MFRFYFLLYFFPLTLSAQSSIEDITTFPIPENEVGCMRYFKQDTSRLHSFNNFILAKFNELMYPERLDYQLRFLQNNQQPIDTLESTHWLKQHQIVNNRNFEVGFRARFQHYFPTEDSVKFHFIYNLEYINHPFVPWKDYFGYDPEVMVINTTDYVLLVFRGTDDIEGNRFGEWVGTDFRFLKTKVEEQQKVHKGLYNSYLVVKEQLEHYFEEQVNKVKPVYLTGHSLGGAQAIFASVDLAELGYNIQQVTTFASPNAIANEAYFERFQHQQIRLDRFEYGNDLVSILDWPGFKEFGNRHWIDEQNRVYYFLPFRNRKLARKAPVEIPKESLRKSFLEVKIKSYHHNPQYIVKALYEQIPTQLRTDIPCIDDSFPYLYYTLEHSK